MSGKVGEPYIPHHNLQVHPKHAQLLCCLLEPQAWTMYLISTVVVQGWIFMYVYAIPQLFRVLDYEAWTTSDREGQPHIPHHNLQLHSSPPWEWLGGLKILQNTGPLSVLLVLTPILAPPICLWRYLPRYGRTRDFDQHIQSWQHLLNSVLSLERATRERP